MVCSSWSMKLFSTDLFLAVFEWQVIDAQVDMPILGAITLYVSLLSFTLRVHPDRLDYVDKVLVCFISNVIYVVDTDCIYTYHMHRVLYTYS